jgi:hypothetical protein
MYLFNSRAAIARLRSRILIFYLASVKNTYGASTIRVEENQKHEVDAGIA